MEKRFDVFIPKTVSTFEQAGSSTWVSQRVEVAFG